MDNRNSWSCTFELEDIEIIDHKTENEDKLGKWHCDQCSLFFLEKGKLDEHKKKHSVHEIVKCKYCNKTISSSSVNRECYMNRKCETCEYKCSNCPQRFLRHSSLMNHEKKHSSPKKKRTINSYKKINGITAENIAVSKGLKKKQIKVGDLEEQDLEELKPKKTVNMKNSLKMKANLEVNAQTILDGEKTPIKKPRRLSLKACKSAEGKDNCEYLPVKTTKRLTLKNNKQLEENNSDAKSKQSTITFNTQTVSQTSNVSNSENVVNYKPFSCHVCGDTFASDSALLDHIRTHGENAAKSFKCKFCGDEFDDIYKMQYHLAICPLAEDELESSLKQVIPANIPTKCSGGTSSPRKRGRPKKMVESPLDREHYMNEPTPSLKRGNFRKRKSEDKESNETGQNPSGPSLPKQSKKSQNKKPLSGPDSIRVSEDSVTDYVPGDISEVTKESELDHEKKKLHQCPFPRCDFKFTREKALLCHMRNHSDDFDDSLKCHKCDIPFDDIHTLRLHINSCKGIKEERDDDFNRGDCYDSSPNRTFHRTKKDFVCNQCGRSYQNQEKLNSHQCIGFEREPIVKKDLRRHKCNVCQAEFQSELEENDHMVTHTRKVAEHLCLRCFHYFKQTSMQQHKCGSQIIKSVRTLIELSISQNNFSPEHIAQMFSSTDSKLSDGIYVASSRNRRIKQNGDKLFLCRICKLSFVSKKMCIKHHKSHGEKNKTTCSSCNGKFSSQKSLKIHERKHKKQLVKCSFCSKEFCDRISLANHMNDDHVKDMNTFECEICNITICDASAVMDHFKFHTFGISEDKNSPKYLGIELDLDSPKEKEVDKCHKLNRNGKNPTRKLGCRPSFYRTKKLATFATSKRNVNGFPSSLRVGVKHVTTRLEPNRFSKFKENVKNEKDTVESKEDFLELRNKENIPNNSLSELAGDSIANSLTEKRTVHNKHLIKSCYIPLENMNFDSTDRFSNASNKNKEVSEAPGKMGQSQVNVRSIKMEKDNDQVICDAKVIEFNYYGHSESFETNNSFENNNSKDLDDSVVIVDHLKVHKCSLCSEIFESIEFLKYHVVVHI